MTSPSVKLYAHLLPLILTRRAKKCYQKAFDLDSSDEECGVALVDALTTSGDEVKHCFEVLLYHWM